MISMLFYRYPNEFHEIISISFVVQKFESRAAFLDALAVDEATLARSRGAAINQACAALPYYLNTYPLIVERSWHKLASLGVRPITN